MGGQSTTMTVLLLAGLAAVGGVLSPPAFGQCDDQNYYWVAGAGDWSVPGNWQHEEPNPYPPPTCIWVPGVPGSADNARVTNGGTTIISGSAYARETILESGGASIVGGSLTTGWEEVGKGGTGTFIQTGGTNTVTGGGLGYGFAVGKQAGSYGLYELRDGQLSVVYHEGVGWEGTGVFVHTGGTNTVGDWLAVGVYPGSDGTYELSGGELDTFSTTIGAEGTGAFIQTGGTNTITGSDLLLGRDAGADGRYELSGGTLSVARWEIVGGWEGTGTFVHSGGINSVGTSLGVGNGETTATGTYELSATGELYAALEMIGVEGSGTFIQTGGTNTVTGVDGCGLLLGVEAGAEGRYELSGGTLSVSTYIVVGGWEGTGTFIHTGGTNTVTDDVSLGKVGGTHGTYELNGDSELSARWGAIGEAGTGVFIQTGGTYTVAENLVLGNSVGGDGTYNLSGTGSLSAVYETVGAGGTGIFTQTGGMNTVGEDLTLGAYSGADGTYELSVGSLLVMGDVWVGRAGAGSLLIDGPLATLDTAHLLIGCGSGTGSLSIANAAAEIIIGDLTFGANATFSAVPGSSIHVDGARVQNYSTDENALAGLENLNLICDGHYVALEVAGYDGGPLTQYCADNFVIDTLTVNDIMSLWDDVDNGNRGGTYGWNEALYINNLVFGPDGILYTNGLHVYVNCEPLSGDHGGHVCYGSGCGDFDHDCDADSADFFDFIACLSGPDVPIGPECNPGDCDADVDVDLTDFAAFQVAFTGP
ncbi:MAG: hypothetical protein KAY37_04820 [Phycisphaerae bacterium]|nr:hypothetical protein [Phycisphaerae bacterium]